MKATLPEPRHLDEAWDCEWVVCLCVHLCMFEGEREKGEKILLHEPALLILQRQKQS